MSLASGDSVSREDRLNAVIAELIEALERDRDWDPTPILRMHPDLAEELRTFLDDWCQFQLNAAAVPSKSRADHLADIACAQGHIGDYQVLEKIACGGMGVVYKAWQKPLNRTVAVKMLLRGASSTPDELRRFQVEAEAAARLHHPASFQFTRSEAMKACPISRCPISLAKTWPLSSLVDRCVHGMPPGLHATLLLP